MEGPPLDETPPEEQHEIPLTFEEQIALADVLRNAVNNRNQYIRGQGGFDTFAEVGQHFNNSRAEYERMEDVVTQARADFDQKVPDKNEFVRQLKDERNEELASLIARMFGVKTGFFSRIFKKR